MAGPVASDDDLSPSQRDVVAAGLALGDLEGVDRAPSIVFVHARIEDALDLLPPSDLLFTSPPYNIDYGAGQHGGTDRGEAEYLDFVDQMPEPDYQAWLKDVLRQLHGRATPGGVRMKSGHWSHPGDHLQGTGWIRREELIWDKGATHQNNRAMRSPVHEHVIRARRLGPGPKIDTPESTILRIPPGAHPRHAFAFPLELPIQVMMDVQATGLNFLDPFGGSGTAAVAAWILGHCPIAVDLSRPALGRGVEWARRLLEQACAAEGIEPPTLHLVDPECLNVKGPGWLRTQLGARWTL